MKSEAVELPRPAGFLLDPSTRLYRFRECTVFVSQELTCFSEVMSSARARWHLSISHQSRYPTWDEIRDACWELIPDGVTMAQLVSPKREHVNLHPNCFHLWQVFVDEVGKP